MVQSRAISTSLSDAGFYCRILPQRALLFWLHLLQCWAGRWVKSIPHNDDGIDALRTAFLPRIHDLQKVFHQIFLPYHHCCSECLRNCCYGKYPPGKPYLSNYFPVDALVFGGPPERLTRSYRIDIGAMCRTLTNVLLKNKMPTSESWSESDKIRACPDLGEQGCKLEWGKRSAFCVLSLCDTFSRQMTWQDYWRYYKASFKYLTVLTGYIARVTGLAKKRGYRPNRGTGCPRCQP